MSEQPLRGYLRAEVRAHILDLSHGGALLLLATPLDVGSIYDFSLDIEGETVWVQAEVRHMHATNTADNAGYEVGVHFVGIDPHDETRLREYLARTSDR